MLKKILQHKIITGIILLLIIGGGYFIYQRLAKNKDEVRYVIAAVEKGTLIVSVSGSGQVTVLDEIDIKPKTSGDITALYVKKDQEVKAGQLFAELDSKDAQKAIRDAQISLDNAQRDLDRKKEDYEKIKIEAESSLATAYEDGYSTVSTVFFKLSDYMKDLKDVLGTEQSADRYIAGYELILGKDSLFIQKLLDDYKSALELFNKNFTFFRTVFWDDDRDTIYQLINDTLETSKALSRALESARHMYDAIMVQSYKHLNIGSYIDTMQSKIASDISAVYSNISSLQRIKDSIDETNKNTPREIEDAQIAIQSAQNTVLQKEDALLDAKDNLAEHFIQAPFGGIIATINDKVKKGDSVSSGIVLATLITKQKIAEISLNEVDVANIKVGQKAILTFDALAEVSISGKVIEVDTIGTVTQGVVSYGVKIAFDTDIEEVKPGMSVTADIITNAKQNVLVLPNSSIRSQGDSYYVELVDPALYSQKGGLEAPEEMSITLRSLLFSKGEGLANVSGAVLPMSPKIQVVEIGLSNDLSTEIISGLKEGDIVVASTISSTKTQTTQTQGTQGFQIPGMGGQGVQGGVRQGGVLRIMR